MTVSIEDNRVRDAITTLRNRHFSNRIVLLRRLDGEDTITRDLTTSKITCTDGQKVNVNVLKALDNMMLIKNIGSNPYVKEYVLSNFGKKVLGIMKGEV